ncbi:MAG: xylulokinase [Acidimicrobiales bacterium]
MTVEDVTVGIDIGTSALKAVVASADGTVVARRRIVNRLGLPSSERMEHDARRAWRLAPRRVLADLGRLGIREPRGICVAGMVPSLAAVDARGVPVSPGLLYGDTRGALPPEVAVLPVGRAPELLRQLSASEPGAAGYWPVQAVANRSLGGPGAIDVTTAIAMSPLFDGAGWDVSVCAEAGCLPGALPAVAGLAEPIGKVGGSVLASGIVDTLAEQIVAGAVEVGDVLVICGTTLVIWVVSDQWREVPGLWTVPHTTPGRTLIGGASNAGGLFLDWATKFTGSAPGQTSPASIPVWAPYPRGERTPFHDTARRASLIGLELSHDRPQVRRAAFEAAGFVVRQHIDLAQVRARRVVATGGGTTRPEWLQALADCTGLPVDVSLVPECGALGAAYVARMAAGLEASLDGATGWARVGHRVHPAEEWTEPASRRYEIFRRLVAEHPTEQWALST